MSHVPVFVRLRSTGRRVRFGAVEQGSPFLYDGEIYVRTSMLMARKLVSSGVKMKPHRFGSRAMEVTEVVVDDDHVPQAMAG